MPQPITLHRTTTTAPPPSPLLVGEPAVCVAPGLTRMWLGDGTANRLLFTSDPLDPLGPGLSQGNYLALTGGTMTGQITTIPPVAGTDAVNINYVQATVAALRNFLGTWQVAANTPDITAGAATAGDYHIAVTANPTVPETAPGGIPGIGGQSVNNGDIVIWDQVGSVWELIRGGPLTVQDGNALYIQKTGDTMTGTLVLAGDPTALNQAANKNYVDAQLGAYLPLSGGVMTGGIVMPAAYVPASNADVATKAYVDSEIGGVISAVEVDGVSILGNGTLAQPLTVGLIDGGTF